MALRVDTKVLTLVILLTYYGPVHCVYKIIIKEL
jgi:hypothetical protein